MYVVVKLPEIGALGSPLAAAQMFEFHGSSV
jgi:hypothetical protein